MKAITRANMWTDKENELLGCTELVSRVANRPVDGDAVLGLEGTAVTPRRGRHMTVNLMLPLQKSFH